MQSILIIGGNGQLGRALQITLQKEKNVPISVWSRPEYDISTTAIIKQITDLKPSLVINAAAWTDVDGAETNADAAFRVNGLGPKYIAQACNLCNARFVHISTNEVFTGQFGTFYYEYDQPQPQSVYARSKLAGERAAQSILEKLFIVRVSWLYGPHGDNFPSKIISAADRHGKLNVVGDEFGSPTYSIDLANAIMQLAHTENYGIYHLINEGVCSRYDWAQLVLEKTGRRDVPISPILSSEWPRPTTPPLHSVLVNQAAAELEIRLRPWQDALAEYCRNI